MHCSSRGWGPATHAAAQRLRVRSGLSFAALAFAVAAAVGVLVTAHAVGTAVMRAVERALTHASRAAGRTPHQSSADPTAAAVRQTHLAHRVVARFAYVGVMALGLLAVALLAGVQFASVVALFATAAFAVGMALQGSLSDLAAGILLSIQNRFAMGDVIEAAGVMGRVVNFSFLNTTLLDNEGTHLVTVPNRVLYAGILQNHTRLPRRTMLHTALVANNNPTDRLAAALRDVERSVARLPEVRRGADLPILASLGRVTQGGTEVNVRLPLEAGAYPNSRNYCFQDAVSGAVRAALLRHGVTLMCGNLVCA